MAGLLVAPNLIGQAPPILTELQARLQLPSSGEFAIESFNEYQPIDSRERAASLELVLEHQPRWLELAQAEDPEWVRSRSYLFEPDWVPLALIQIRSVPGRETQAESLRLRGEAFHWSSPAQVSGKAGGPQSGVSHWLGVDDELFVWSEVGAERSSTLRYSAVGQSPGVRGAMFVFVEFCARTKKALALAGEQGGVVAGDDELEFRLDLRSTSVLDRFPPFYPPAGLMQMPGQVVGRFERASGHERLELEWTCTSGATICREELVWVEGNGLPSSVRRELFAPGVESPVSVFASASVQFPGSEQKEIRWVPLPGDTVADYRFHSPLHYHIGDDLEVPEDAWLAEQAERNYLLENQEAFDEYSFESSTEVAEPEPSGGFQFGSMEGPATQIRARLTAPWDTLDLGRQPIKSMHPVRFEILNDGPLPLTVGEPTAGCTCIDVSLLTRRLEPGESASLTARQQVPRAGTSMVAIHVPFRDDEGREDEIKLFVRVEGVRAPLISPDPIHLGRVGAGAPLTFTVRVAGGGCVDQDGVPRASAEGYRVEETWRAGAEDGGEWGGSLTLLPEGTPVLGATEVLLRVRGDLCPDVEGEALIFFERVPEDVGDAWPNCRVVLELGGQEPLELLLPDTTIHAVRGGGGGGLEHLEATVRSTPGGDVLVLRERPSQALLLGRQVLLQLDTSRGAVGVKAILPRSPQENIWSAQFGGQEGPHQAPSGDPSEEE